MNRRAPWIGIIIMLMVWTGICNAESDGSGYTGISWGFTRTWWSASANDEGYPRAGTAGAVISLRRVKMMNDRIAFSPYIQYFWMRSTTTNLVPDMRGERTITDRTYFREIDLGFNFHLYPVVDSRQFYIGAGPSIRWGQSGRWNVDDNRAISSSKAAWFGLMLLAGYRTSVGEHTTAFFEPQLLFSPDQADRWQAVHPPDNLNLHMGILWE